MAFLFQFQLFVCAHCRSPLSIRFDCVYNFLIILFHFQFRFCFFFHSFLYRSVTLFVIVRQLLRYFSLSICCFSPFNFDINTLIHLCIYVNGLSSLSSTFSSRHRHCRHLDVVNSNIFPSFFPSSSSSMSSFLSCRWKSKTICVSRAHFPYHIMSR